MDTHCTLSQLIDNPLDVDELKTAGVDVLLHHKIIVKATHKVLVSIQSVCVLCVCSMCVCSVYVCV